MKSGEASKLLFFLFNDEKLFEFVQQVTGCEQIGCFSGRVYRVIPGRSHYHVWHTDADKHRMVAGSINLSTEIYCGGALQIRKPQSEQVLHEVSNTGFGDAIFFRISPFLAHRLTDIKGTVAKTACAGWFQSKPNWTSFLKKPVTSSEQA